MRILLTGANGFIGSAVLRLALAQGHEVAALVRPGKNVTATRVLAGTLDEPPWDEILSFEPEVCIHSAWIATPGVYLESPENEQLVEWSEKFVRIVAELGALRVVALGTCLEYEFSGKVLSEANSPLASTTAYSRAKNALRLKLETAAKADGFSLCWGRVFYPYGPGEQPGRLPGLIIRNLQQGKVMELKTPHGVKDYIYIEDLAAAILALATSSVTGVVNLGTGTGITVLELANTLATLLGKPQLVRESPTAVHDPKDYVVADASKLHALGWTPRVALREGLQRLLQSLP
jgi:nucleoside-diphosphate-sugar epimerase